MWIKKPCKAKYICARDVASKTNAEICFNICKIYAMPGQVENVLHKITNCFYRKKFMTVIYVHRRRMMLRLIKFKSLHTQ